MNNKRFTEKQIDDIVVSQVNDKNSWEPAIQAQEKEPRCGLPAEEESRHCPHCKANLDGEPIPRDKRKYYGKSTHFGRETGIEVSGVYDGVLYWVCPDCNGEWLRFAEGQYNAYQDGKKVVLNRKTKVKS